MIEDSRGLEAVILDLGGVIVPLDYGRTYRLFAERFQGVDAGTFCGGRSQDRVYSLFETGELTQEEFRFSFRDRSGAPVDPVWFDSAWNAMILGLPAERVEWLHQLGKVTRLFLFSNINAIHYDRLNALYTPWAPASFSDLFERAYFSHLFGFRKPDPEGFRRILEENNLDPSRTLFVDDGLHHVEAARTVGLRAEHLEGGESIEDLIRRFGVMK